MQLGPNQLQLSDRHYWAQSMKSSIEAVLVKQLNGHNNSVQLLSETEPGAGQSEYQLHVQVFHFLIEQENAVTLQASYWLTDRQGQQRLISADSDISLPLTENGYQHGVAQMYQALIRFTQQLSQQLDTFIAENKT